MGMDVQHYNARGKFLEFVLEGFNLWDWIAEHYDFSRAKKILEVACATGDFWNHVNNRANTVEEIILTDHSENMIAVAKNTLKDSPLLSKIQFEVMDAEALKYPDQSFDVVFSHHLMVNQPKSVPQVLTELTRVLRKDGWLGIATMNMRTVRELFSLANKIDSRFPAQSAMIKHFDENTVDMLLPKYFKRIHKYSYDAMMRIPSSEIIMDFMRSHPISLSLGLKEDFFNVFQKTVDSIIVQKGSIETVFTPTLYICKSLGSSAN